MMETAISPSSIQWEDVARTPFRVRWTLLAVCATLALAGFFTANSILTSAAFLSLPILCYLVWRQGEPPVLVFACVFQWLQATAAIFYTNQYGVTLGEAFGDYALTFATWLSIGAVASLAVGIRCGLLGAGPSRREPIEAAARKVNLGRAAVLYIVSFIVSTVLTRIAFLFTGFTQEILAIAGLKWVFVFLVCYAVLQQRRGYGILILCVLLEFVSGFAGAFSNFKSVFFVLAVAAMASPAALKGRRLFASGVCFIALFASGVIWTAVKMDYRTFLAEESIDEDSSVPMERKFEKLTDLVESLTWENVVDGIDGMIMRVSYVHFFALTIENVPNRVPFEDGRLWGGSVVHVLTPRFLFPNKPVLDDSERTVTYTGVQVSGMEQGTSIGIGYVGESYIDFGPIGMFAPIFLLGVFYGLLYQCFVTRSRYKLIGSAIAVSVLIFNAYEIETSNIKIVGGVVAAAAVAIVVYKVFGRWLSNYLTASPRTHLRPWQ